MNMTQIPAKKSSASQAIPSFKKKNSSRRSSRSRSRGRHSRRSTPPRSLASQTVETDSVEKLLPTAVDHSVRNIVKENSTPFENHPLQTSMKSSETTSGMEKFIKAPSLPVNHPYILTFIHLLMCVLYAFVIYKAMNYFGVDRFVIKHWIQWSKKIHPNLSP
uniref:Uncharacterized protein n=1 Tax=Onchocerca volvulus TaxID=6282 RepID=A0A8R1TQA9_ONCVO